MGNRVKVNRGNDDIVDAYLQSPALRKEFEYYADLIKLDQNDLHTAALQQAQIFMEICEKGAYATSRRDAAKDLLSLTDAEESHRIRSSTTDKMTEGAIKEKVEISLKHGKASADYESARYEADCWSKLERAFEMRAKMLQILTSQYVAGYFTVQTSVGAGTRAKRADADAGREALHEARIQRKM